MLHVLHIMLLAIYTSNSLITCSSKDLLYLPSLYNTQQGREGLGGMQPVLAYMCTKYMCPRLSFLQVPSIWRTISSDIGRERRYLTLYLIHQRCSFETTLLEPLLKHPYWFGKLLSWELYVHVYGCCVMQLLHILLGVVRVSTVLDLTLWHTETELLL